MPGLIVVNGHGGDKYTWYAFYAGILYARAGAVVLTYDPIGEGERNSERKSGTRQHDRKVDPPEMARRMGGLMMADVLQAVSYLASRDDVDAARLGAMGYSMGSFVLGLTCAVEARLHGAWSATLPPWSRTRAAGLPNLEPRSGVGREPSTKRLRAFLGRAASAMANWPGPGKGIHRSARSRGI